MGKDDVASSGLDQSTNHHGNMYGKDNDYSQSYETPRKKIAVITIFVIQSPPPPHHDFLHYLNQENNIYILKLKREVTMHHNAQNQEH